MRKPAASMSLVVTAEFCRTIHTKGSARPMVLLSDPRVLFDAL
jgi:hypothetical protein